MSIGTSAFSTCNLTSIEIPESVTDIGEWALASCSSLTSVSLPENLTNIGKGVFSGCSSLTSIAIPKSVTTIGEKAFADCSCLTSITIPENVDSIGNYAFRRCTSFTSITIPKSVTSIGEGAFSGCNNITAMTVAEDNPIFDSRNNCHAIIETNNNTLIAGCSTTKIPESVTCIGREAFYTCENLTTITIPEGVTSIGDQAFYSCRNLTTVFLPASLTEIGMNIFGQCEKIQDIYCYAENVPMCPTALGPTLKQTTLHVPANALGAYKSTYPWNLFGNIAILDDESKTYLVTEGKQWAVYYEQSWNQDQPVVTHTFRLQGDTVINGFTYKKKWMSVEKDLSDWSLFPSYMREENGKVYVMNSRGEEALWFDYNAQVGDTLCLTSKQATQQCYGLVTSIDDVVLEHSDGKQRKRYEVVLGREAISGGVYFTDECIYIHEDVGMFNSSTYGYGLGDHTLFNYGNKFKLLCVHDNGIALYQSPDGCYKEATSKTYLVTEGKEWAIARSWKDEQLEATTIYRLQGDTMINGKTYKQTWIRASESSPMQQWPHFMREENGKVYINKGGDSENLWFDYTAQVGDTLCFGNGYGKISSIDHVPWPMVTSSKLCMRHKVLLGAINDTLEKISFGEEYIYVYEGIGVLNSENYGYGLGGHILTTQSSQTDVRLLYVYDNDRLLYMAEEPEPSRPTTKRGYGIYHGDTYLYRYTIDESKEVTDSTDFARWYDKTVIYFDVDTIGPNAFSGATFRQGQMLYFTERLNTILPNAFSNIMMLDDKQAEEKPFGDLCIVFNGNAPSIDKSSISNYADTTYHITYVVPDLAAYIENDIQWTYSQLVTIDDFVQGYVSPENEITVNDSTDTDVNLQPGTNQDGNIDLVVHARPRKDIPVRIGEGENKDIYSRAPAWMRYTMELRITDTEGTELYAGEMQCSAYGECQFNVSFACPADNIIHIYSRSIDMFGRATEWAVTTINLDTSIDPIVAPNTDAPYYDLQGRPVAHPTRGIYIRNGRKVVL